MRSEREAVPQKPLKRRLELSGIRYSYPGTERSALRGLDLTIEANTTIGIVGGTGAGKTTLVDIMLGLLDPAEGSMRVDGEVITPETRRSWQKTLGYVPQTIFLSDGTVAENIAFGHPPDQIDRAAVERAARIAALHDFVTTELPNGYDTTVGERGVRLSGGQRQRVGIARALYHDPAMLILDEATSALDNLTERAVMEAVHNIAGQKTIVMIAHRLSTVRNCDRIFVLRDGRVAASGRIPQDGRERLRAVRRRRLPPQNQGPRLRTPRPRHQEERSTQPLRPCRHLPDTGCEYRAPSRAGLRPLSSSRRAPRSRRTQGPRSARRSDW
jgi:ABC-type multidrug transport system fused ATPase/permease subunit